MGWELPGSHLYTKPGLDCEDGSGRCLSQVGGLGQPCQSSGTDSRLSRFWGQAQGLYFFGLLLHGFHNQERDAFLLAHVPAAKDASNALVVDWKASSSMCL